MGSGAENIWFMSENEERTSDSGSVSQSVLNQLATLNAQFEHLATREQVINLEKSIETWKGEMTQAAHDIASKKVTEAMKKRHETCSLEFEKLVSDKMEKHLSELHKRTSYTPSADSKKYQAFFNALGPFVVRWILPALLGGGALYGGQKILNNTTQPDAVIAPVGNQENK